MTRDLYGEARALGVGLWDAGHPDWSQRVDDVVAGGATASEILMGLRWTFREAVRRIPGLDPDLRGRIEELCAQITAALGQQEHPRTNVETRPPEPTRSRAGTGRLV